MAQPAMDPDSPRYADQALDETNSPPPWETGPAWCEECGSHTNHTTRQHAEAAQEQEEDLRTCEYLWCQRWASGRRELNPEDLAYVAGAWWCPEHVPADLTLPLVETATVPPPEPVPPAEALARAVLMFYQGGPWTLDDRAKWHQVTGSPEATTKVLGDLARRVLDLREERR